jgi:hypothetical protein
MLNIKMKTIFFFNPYQVRSGSRRSLEPNRELFFIFSCFGGTIFACLDPDLLIHFESGSNQDPKPLPGDMEWLLE